MPRLSLITVTLLGTATALLGCGGEPLGAPAHTVTVPATNAAVVEQTPATARATDPARIAYIRRADRVCSGSIPGARTS